MRSLRVVLTPLFALAAAATSPAADGAAEPVLSLEEVVAVVRSAHPSLAAGRARVEALEAAARREAAWEDPMAGINVMREGTTDPFDPAAIEWMIEQKLPLSGRNRLAAAVMRGEGAVAQAGLAAIEVDLVAEAKTVFFELANLHRQIELNATTQGLVRQFIEISRKKYEVGRETQTTVLAAETSLARLEEEALGLASELAAARIRLATLMNQPAAALAGRPVLDGGVPVLPDTAAVQAAALDHHPRLQGTGAMSETARARLALARRTTTPDPAVRIAARTRDGSGRLISDYDTAVVINLPWLNPRRTRHEIATAERGVRAARHDEETARLEVLGRLHEQWERLAARARQLALVRDRLLPLARHTIEATRVAYETDRATFLELIDAQRTATEVESAWWRDLADYHIGLADLERAAGGTLPGPRP